MEPRAAMARLLVVAVMLTALCSAHASRDLLRSAFSTTNSAHGPLDLFIRGDQSLARQQPTMLLPACARCRPAGVQRH